MKFLVLFFLFSVNAFACNLEPLKKEIISDYGSYKTVTNERGELGHGRGTNFSVSNQLTYMKDDIFLIANFDMNIKWLTGKEQTVRTLVVAAINPRNCTIRGYEGQPRLAGN